MKNNGRKGPPLPPEMAAYAERLQRAYKARKEADGLNQVELSHRSGLSQSTISEAMDEDKPKVGITAAVIVRLCIGLDVTPDFVLMGVGDEIPRLARRSAASRTPQPVELREAEAPIAPLPSVAPPSTPARTVRPRASRKSATP